ncbi:efflux RND transporter periplasmic adaptor subunit [Cellulomonas sp. PhB150]|uniref:efflux RND transporter periplasmic adaptor subunit n=1 Tax=Cellulomonas sp. PhB150 TaxID=2485188 RepID=UPI000F47D375|nr:biotin/lipoyl-binding protein [Cellulomonas sp. PhB150]ROS31635.1 macrolide-specific efflux system membrane fusion protein [Cellulomonas sp. PhB150]
MRARWRRTRPWARVVGAVVILGLVATGAWWVWWRQPASAEAQGPTTRTVQASLSTMEKTVSGTGTLEPTVQEDVSFAVSGTVTKVKVAAGDTVRKGQVLATVDTLTLDADLLSAKSTLAQAKAKLADADDAADGTDSSDAQIAAAQAQVDVAQAGVDDAKDAVGDAVLEAPAAGLVTTADLEVGDVVTGSSSSGSSGAGSSSGGASGSSQPSSQSSTSTTTSTGQFVIVGTGAWQVATTVSEADVANVAAGDQVEMTSDDLSDTLYGTVASVGLVSTSTSGVAAYPVVVDVTGDTAKLHDGTSVDVSIIYERRTDVLTVPALAVTTADGASTVTVQATDGTQKKVTVKTGETSGNLVEITDGLAEGDAVVVQTFQAGTGNRQGGQTGQTGQVPGGGDFPGGFPGGGSFQGGQGTGQGGPQGGGTNG